ncbi:MAG: hypothetical protein H7263_14685 [Candidatus Sericytochromatia bacterium]|nr:hypothetical protein [Candidatus Sericytochromatia bacterium]
MKKIILISLFLINANNALASDNVAIFKISVDQNEKEILRVENIQFQDGNYYDQQKIEAKIIIKNSKNKKIRLKTKRLIEGKLEASDYKWENSSLSVYKTQNKTNQVEWDVQFNPKESKEIIYNYSSFIKRPSSIIL